MKPLLPFLLIIILITATGCTGQPEDIGKPAGNGIVDVCSSDPPMAGYWQNNKTVLWDSPGSKGEGGTQGIGTGVPACANATIIIWEHTTYGEGDWYRVMARSGEGSSVMGWLPAGNLMNITNETGTEWSENYSGLLGSWDQAGRGNGARIWYEFHADGTFTFNYDMRGNRDNIQDTGSWTYLGNNTWDLTSCVGPEYKHTYISLNPGGKSFNAGTEYSLAAKTERQLVFRKT